MRCTIESYHKQDIQDVVSHTSLAACSRFSSENVLATFTDILQARLATSSRLPLYEHAWSSRPVYRYLSYSGLRRLSTRCVYITLINCIVEKSWCHL